MTLNLVLKAKADNAIDAKGAALTCATIARRWLDIGQLVAHGSGAGGKTDVRRRPAGSIGPDNIERIETNLQIAHVTQSPAHEFRTDYLLKVFDYNPQSKVFEEATLEDQIDRERLLSDEKLKARFQGLAARSRASDEFDRGTVLIPKEFLATARDCAHSDRLLRLAVATGFWPCAGRGRKPCFFEG